MNLKMKLINNWKRNLNLWNQLLKLLNEKERKDVKELLTNFQEVFACSYEDMPGIDHKIAQHHIDTHAHMVPVKQNLRHMRTEWLLKIKEEVTK